MLAWFILVFIAILYYFVEFGLVLTYGEQVWTDELSSPTYIVLDFLTCVIFLADIFVCLNCGFLYRGMIILDDIRITRKYFAYNFFIDTLSLIIVVICPASGVYVLNYLKLFLLLKMLRLSDIDDFFLRRFNINRIGKALYVIFKMVVIIFLLSHFLGLIFYAMDYYYLMNDVYPPDCNLFSLFSMLARSFNSLFSNHLTFLPPPVPLHSLLGRQYNNYNFLW